MKTKRKETNNKVCKTIGIPLLIAGIFYGFIFWNSSPQWLSPLYFLTGAAGLILCIVWGHLLK